MKANQNWISRILISVSKRIDSALQSVFNNCHVGVTILDQSKKNRISSWARLFLGLEKESACVALQLVEIAVLAHDQRLVAFDDSDFVNLFRALVTILELRVQLWQAVRILLWVFLLILFLFSESPKRCSPHPGFSFIAPFQKSQADCSL
jgi:hypothetical protein